MENLYKILTSINSIILIIFGVAFSLQIIYMLFFFLPAKKFKKAQKKHRFGIIICARNEESVIAETIKCLKDQNYPKDLYDIFVMAHNCTDNTAQIARENGAIVYEENDPDPKHRRVSYALKSIFAKILENHDVYDAFIRFDADCFVHPDFTQHMNDALDGGAKLAKGYNNAKNIEQNVIAGISGLWYVRDSRFNCQARSAFRMGQLMTGSGMMISAEVIRKNGGWTDMGLTEDADFSISQLIKGNKAEYVKDAIIYEDQPTTLKDTFIRNMRMGRGLIKTFFKHGIRSLLKFFTRPYKPTYLDMFVTEFFIPIALIGVMWLPAYYVYAVVYNSVIGNMAELMLIRNMLIISLTLFFIVPFILQAMLVYALERKKINSSFKKLLPSMLLFPMFMIFYAAGIVLGILTSAKWKAVERTQGITYDEFKQRFKFDTENQPVCAGILETETEIEIATETAQTNDEPSEPCVHALAEEERDEN